MKMKSLLHYLLSWCFEQFSPSAGKRSKSLHLYKNLLPKQNNILVSQRVSSEIIVMKSTSVKQTQLSSICKSAPSVNRIVRVLPANEYKCTQRERWMQGVMYYAPDSCFTPCPTDKSLTATSLSRC